MSCVLTVKLHLLFVEEKVWSEKVIYLCGLCYMVCSANTVFQDIIFNSAGIWFQAKI